MPNGSNHMKTGTSGRAAFHRGDHQQLDVISKDWRPGSMLARLHSRNVSDTSPIPSLRVSPLMPNSCGDVGVSTSKIKDVHFRGWEHDCLMFTTKLPFGSSLEIVVSKCPLPSETRTFCSGEGPSGKKSGSMATVKRSGNELASKV